MEILKIGLIGYLILMAIGMLASFVAFIWFSKKAFNFKPRRSRDDKHRNS